MRLALIFIRQFAFGLALGCFLSGAIWLGAGFLFASFALWSIT